MNFILLKPNALSRCTKKFESGLVCSNIKGLTGKGLKIGVQVAANDRSAIIGYSPDQNVDAFYLNMGE